MDLNPLELAWAGGFFDGEGSTTARIFRARPGYRQVAISVPQSGDQFVPEVLERFKRAMGGIGTISGPNAEGMYFWRVFGREHIRATLRLLWPYIGAVKRAQATHSIRLVEGQYEDGTFVRRASRSIAPSLKVATAEPPAADVEAAWAAGFLDAEGCFGLNRAGLRKNGPDWYRVRCSANQHGTVESAPQVLKRMHALLGGRIEGHGEADDYKWVVEGQAQIEAVLKVVGPWLSGVKREQSARALSAFRAQIRLKGDATHCKRGHPYSRTVVKGGRSRKICDTCELLYKSRERERRLLAFQRFEEDPVPYTA